MALRLPTRLQGGLVAGSKHHFSISTYLENIFSPQCRSYGSSRGPATKKTKKTELQDAYAVKHAEQRRAANIARQAVVKKERAEAMGDPIRGVTTPFIESLTAAIPQEVQPTVDNLSNKPESGDPTQPPPSPAYAEKEDHLNYYLSKPELNAALEYSKDLNAPIKGSDRATADPTLEAEQEAAYSQRDVVAREALNRITSLANASSEERTRANIRRIIDTFGRHNTDTYLRPKATSQAARDAEGKLAEVTPRAGPDTGSSEVQIAILTARIRNLADRYQGRDRRDKANKRNLRLLLHRRQKLLKYMEKKERGSDRWHNMVSTLGLTEATYKGEIAVQ